MPSTLNLTQNVDVVYPDDPADPSTKQHQADHDGLHGWARKFDQTPPSDGQALVWNATTQLWTPTTIGTGGGGSGSITVQAADGSTSVVPLSSLTFVEAS